MGQEEALSSLKDWFLATQIASPLPRILLLDGGVSTHLEEMRKAPFPHRTLWSSSLLLDPDGQSDILKAHRVWLDSGVNILSTISYQLHYDQDLIGLELDVDHLLQRAVQLAREAIQTTQDDGMVHFVVASSGCYGAALSNGAEYTGDYPEATDTMIESFHRRKLVRFIELQPDGIAVETIPSLREVHIVRRVLDSLEVSCACYVSLACRNGSQLNDGSPLEDAVKVLRGCEAIQGVGLNCCSPQYLPELSTTTILHLPSHIRTVILYPNSGETWNPVNAEFEALSGTPPHDMPRVLMSLIRHVDAKWNECRPDAVRPPQILIGGCCRTTPSTMRNLRVLVEQYLAKEGT